MKESRGTKIDTCLERSHRGQGRVGWIFCLLSVFLVSINFKTLCRNSLHEPLIKTKRRKPLHVQPSRAEHRPEAEGTSSSGRGQRAGVATGTRGGGDPARARRPHGTATLASAPTCIPVHPAGGRGDTQRQSESHHRRSYISREIWKYFKNHVTGLGLKTRSGLCAGK